MNAPVRSTQTRPTDQVKVIMTRAEATALQRAAETGIRVTEALNFANSIAVMDAAVRKLRDAL
jgi:serine/threonine-protein kinase RIO1